MLIWEDYPSTLQIRTWTFWRTPFQHAFLFWKYKMRPREWCLCLVEEILLSWCTRCLQALGEGRMSELRLERTYGRSLHMAPIVPSGSSGRRWEFNQRPLCCPDGAINHHPLVNFRGWNEQREYYTLSAHTARWRQVLTDWSVYQPLSYGWC